MTSDLSPNEIVRTTEVPNHKRNALEKLISRILEVTTHDANKILIHAFGERALKLFTFGDIFDLANTDAFSRAVHATGIDVPSVQVLRVVNMIAQITDETEPCENKRCGEFPIYERGGVIRKDAPNNPCLYCEHVPTKTIEAIPSSPRDATKRILGGDYQIERFIAEGAIGRTYLATDLVVGKSVCVKHCFKLNAARQDNLLDEARKMWDLRHHGIPAMRRVIRLEDKTIAIVMGYIPGETLEAIVKHDGAIHPESAMWILERLLNILQYLHAHGVIHGDFKPQNIIVNEETYAVTLVDFGLATVKPTDASRAIGYTDHFAPSEQVYGNPPIPESDIYALGKVALYLLNGGNLDQVDRDFFPAHVPALCSDFVQSMVAKSIEQRPSRADRLFDRMRHLRRAVYGRELFNKGEKPIRGVS
ncbi:MAG: serine/threonine-protein kinase [Candidatus Uhrbacteria bacterium]|nr:serine/threonine-protein kinase [Candidatus Uhrbacteria bacterium]